MFSFLTHTPEAQSWPAAGTSLLPPDSLTSLPEGPFQPEDSANAWACEGQEGTRWAKGCPSPKPSENWSQTPASTSSPYLKDVPPNVVPQRPAQAVQDVQHLLLFQDTEETVQQDL